MTWVVRIMTCPSGLGFVQAGKIRPWVDRSTMRKTVGKTGDVIMRAYYSLTACHYMYLILCPSDITECGGVARGLDE